VETLIPGSSPPLQDQDQEEDVGEEEELGHGDETKKEEKSEKGCALTVDCVLVILGWN
jgi:hypothetical protein